MARPLQDLLGGTAEGELTSTFLAVPGEQKPGFSIGRPS